MRENTLRKIWSAGGTVVNAWLSIPSAFSAEVVAHQGYDSLTIDMQHGVVDYQTAVTMLQAISTTPVIPLARVPWNDPAILMKSLDAGVYGVICPMINTRAEAEALVRACKYPPRGYRSFGPVRASIYAGSDYVDHANDDLIVMPMIETAEALKNLDEILSVPGVDAVYVGPADLSLALGCRPRLDQTDPPVVKAQLDIERPEASFRRTEFSLARRLEYSCQEPVWRRGFCRFPLPCRSRSRAASGNEQTGQGFMRVPMYPLVAPPAPAGRQGLGTRNSRLQPHAATG